MAREHAGLSDEQLFVETQHNLWFESYADSRKHYKLYHGRLSKRGYRMVGVKTLPLIEGDSLAKVTGISYVLRFTVEKTDEAHNTPDDGNPAVRSEHNSDVVQQPFQQFDQFKSLSEQADLHQADVHQTCQVSEG